MNRSRQIVRSMVTMGLVGGLCAAGFYTRDHWLPLLSSAKPAGQVEPLPQPNTLAGKVIVGEQAQQNLGLFAKPLAAQTFWKTIQVPGMVVDRPGQSDRGIVAPATGVVVAIAHFPGDTVRPGAPLFTLKLLSESLHQSQTDLFTTTQDIKLATAQRKRLEASAGAIPESRIIEVNDQITRLQVAVRAYRQELLNRGLVSSQIDRVAEGSFVSEISIAVPARPANTELTMTSLNSSNDVGGADKSPAAFEVQDLKVDLGQQVQAGQTLCVLSNHQLLVVEGRAFRDETPLLEQSVKEGWPVEVDFQEDAGADWPPVVQDFRIRHLANTIDPVNRTFAFRVPLQNQSRAVEQDGRTQTLWRFRPGQKVRLLVRVARLDNVFIVPADAVARDGSDVFVFTQNVNAFERKPVRALLHDRRQIVLANDGSVLPGAYVVQTAAMQLNRMVKAGAGSNVPKGFHVHADGSLHKNEDEVQ